MRKLALAGIAVLLVGVSVPAAAVFDPKLATLFERDAPLSKDDPLIVRFPDSHILLQTASRYDELTLPAGTALGQPYSSQKRFSKTVHGEGRVSRTIYIAQSGVSSLEMLRSMQSRLAETGWRPVYQCAEAACGAAFAPLKYSYFDKSTLVSGEKMETDRARFVNAVFEKVTTVRYILMTDGKTSNPAYVAIYAAMHSGGTNGVLSDTLNGRAAALVEVVQPT